MIVAIILFPESAACRAPQFLELASRLEHFNPQQGQACEVSNGPLALCGFVPWKMEALRGFLVSFFSMRVFGLRGEWNVYTGARHCLFCCSFVREGDDWLWLALLRCCE